LKRLKEYGANILHPVYRKIDISYFRSKGYSVVGYHNKYENAIKFFNESGDMLMSDNMELFKKVISNK